MAPVIVNPNKVRSFKDADAFYKWLSKNHAREDELWIKIHKVGSGLKSITAKEAIDVVLCWGWIDAVRKSYDAQSFLQHNTPQMTTDRTRASLFSHNSCRPPTRASHHTTASRDQPQGPRSVTRQNGV